MPYLTPRDRTKLDPHLWPLAAAITKPAELNYAICRLLDMVVLAGVTVDYATLSAFNAAVNDASREFERRVIAPYEDRKCRTQGEVFELVLRQ